MKYDEESRLWKPSRRSFFFLGASAAVGAMLPAARPLSPFEELLRMNKALVRTKAAQQLHAEALDRMFFHGVRKVMVSGRGGYLYPEGTGIFAPR